MHWNSQYLAHSLILRCFLFFFLFQEKDLQHDYVFLHGNVQEEYAD